MKNVMKALKTFEQWLIGILLLVTVFLLFINVVMRYIFSSNLTWAEEFSRYAVVWISFVGASVCVYKGGHITVDSILSVLSDSKKRILTVCILALSVAFSLMLGYYSLLLTINSLQTKQITPGLGIPMFWAYLAMPVGSLLLAIRFGWQLYGELKTTGGKS